MIRAWEECGAISIEKDPRAPFTPHVLGLAVSPDARWLVATTGHNAHAWRVAQDFSESALAWTFDTGLEIFPEFSPDGSMLAISGDGRAVFDIESGTLLFSPIPPPAIIIGCPMAFFGFSRRGEWVAGTGYNHGVEVFATATQSLLTTLPSGSCNSAVAFSADNALMATGVPELYRTGDGTRVWPEVLTQQPTNPVDGSTPMAGVSFTSDGKYLLVSRCKAAPDILGPCEHRFFSVANGAPVGEPLPFRGARPSFSADRQWLVAGGDVYRVATGELRHLGDYSAAAFTSNGDIFAGTTDGTLKRLCARR